MRKKSGKSHNKGSGKKKQTTPVTGGVKGGSVEAGQGSPRPVRKGKSR